jgi:starch synthase
MGAMSVLFAVSEVFPWVKTGGLADVACYLPMALNESGIDVRIVTPAYRSIMSQVHEYRVCAETSLPEAGIRYRILQVTLPDSQVPVYLVDIPELYDRPGGPYTDPSGADWPDNALRYAQFCRVIVAMALNQTGLHWRPDLLQCNDWHTGLAPALLKAGGSRLPVVFTIHNLAYQGIFPYELFRSLRLPAGFWSPDALEFYGNMSFIKGGLVYADRLITVSPRYAEEITTPEYGCGMDGLLSNRREQLTGILNGVDYRYWDPRNDTHIWHHYWIDSLEKRRLNKLELQEELGLNRDPEAIILAHISRLTGQKGTDLILFGLADLLPDNDLQLVVLGTGESGFETALLTAASARAGQMSVCLYFDEGLAHRIQASADLLLMPSRFEPCGLTQLYALRYGCIPVVCATGGLADTITDVDDQSLKDGTATGFQFQEPATSSLVTAVRRALAMRRGDARAWQRLVTSAMQKDFSWQNSARGYARLFADLISATPYRPVGRLP